MSKAVPRILVVGGGAGGLELVTSLGRKLGRKGLAQVYLSDGTTTHVWKPLLHEVATGALNVGEDEVNYFTHGNRNGYRFHFGWMRGVDRERKVIKTARITDLEGNEVSGPREFKYDTLVLAVGARTNSFGTPGVEEHCLRLDSQHEAERLRRRFLGRALALAFKKIPKISIGIVGAGPTGVELAAEIHHTMTEIKSYGATIASDSLEMTILEAAPSILPGMPPHMSQFAAKALTNRGIKISTNTQIKEVNEKGFVLGDGSVLEKDIKIWTAGIKAPDWLTGTGLQLDNINRIKVNGFLQSIDDPNIFAFGDCANCPDGGEDPNKVCPATAQCAHQQADYLLKRFLNGFKGNKKFVYNSQGILVSLGSTTAVGTLSGVVSDRNMNLYGRKAKFLYSTIYRMHQARIYGHFHAGCILVGDKLRSISMPSVRLH